MYYYDCCHNSVFSLLANLFFVLFCSILSRLCVAARSFLLFSSLIKRIDTQLAHVV